MLTCADQVCWKEKTCISKASVLLLKLLRARSVEDKGVPSVNQPELKKVNKAPGFGLHSFSAV